MTEGLLPGNPAPDKKDVVRTSGQINFTASTQSVEVVLVGLNADDMPIKRRSIDLSRAEWDALVELMKMRP